MHCIVDIVVLVSDDADVTGVIPFLRMVCDCSISFVPSWLSINMHF